MRASSPSLPSHGQVVDGKYELQEVLGEGGMGVVWAARHRLLGTELAIKILLPEARDAETVARFHREARASVRMSSVHAARVHDVAEAPDGTPYMVMERLRGHDLGDLLERQGPLPAQLAIDYVVQALHALEEAHAIGLVHRDLKPSNLYLATQPNGASVIKVLDFGIARDFHDRDDGRLTSTRAVMGSPSYMSPEQLRAARAADPRSDIWSIGVCLYELVTGRLPFDAATLPDLMVAVLQSQPTPPQSLAPGIPHGLVEVIGRCLEKDPTRRFQSATELRAALVAAKSTGVASSPRLALDHASHSSLPAVATTDPSLVGRHEAPSSSSRRGMVAFAAAFAFVSVAAVVAFLVLRPKAPAHGASTSSQATAASTTDTIASPLPPDLAAAGGGPAPPATGAASAPPPSASAAVSVTPPAKSAAPSATGRAPSKGEGKRPSTPASPAGTPGHETPPTAAPPRPPDFDPGKSF